MKRTPLVRKTPLKCKGNGLKRTPIKRISAKRKDELREYRRRKKEYFAMLAEKQGFDRCLCEVCGERFAKDWHHVRPLGAGGKLNQEEMLAVCRTCHNWIHANPGEARKRLLLI